MSAKWMKAVNITSSLSKRERILRKPLNRASGLAIARRLSQFKHLRQPYESWWSTLHAIFRWPVDLFF